MKNKILLSVVGLFSAAALFFGTCYSWVLPGNSPENNVANVNVPEWIFGDRGFAKIENISGLSYLTATKEETITQGSEEEAKEFGKIFGMEDAKEGIQAFMEKRKPDFKDR